MIWRWVVAVSACARYSWRIGSRRSAASRGEHVGVADGLLVAVPRGGASAGGEVGLGVAMTPCQSWAGPLRYPDLACGRRLSLDPVAGRARCTPGWPSNRSSSIAHDAGGFGCDDDGGRRLRLYSNEPRRTRTYGRRRDSVVALTDAPELAAKGEQHEFSEHGLRPDTLR